MKFLNHAMEKYDTSRRLDIHGNQMGSNRDTLFRQWHMLRRIPRYPSRRATREIAALLASEGFEVTNRTVERDLDKLSTTFGYTCEEEGRTKLWFWPETTRPLDVPNMESATALAFNLAQRHLLDLLPPAVTNLLDPYFQRASEVLESVTPGRPSAWRKKVRVLGVAPELKPATVDPEIQSCLYDCLFQNQRARIRYQGRWHDEPTEYDFSPLGLVVRQGVIYLIGPVHNYDNVIQIALHRVRHAEKTDKRAHRPKGFDLDSYIGEQQEFSYPTGEGTIRLKLSMDEQAALHLIERPLSDDQTVSEADDDGRVTLSATVTDTDALIWWLLGFGPSVEVLKPVALRRKLAGLLEDAAEQYRQRRP